MLRFFHAPRSASSLYVAVAALLLCLLASAQPASAEVISTNTTISTFIDGDVIVIASSTGSPTVNLVDGGTIAYNLIALDASTVNVSGGTIQGFLVARDASTVNVSGGTIGRGLAVLGPNARLNVVGTGLSLSEPMLNEGGQTFVVLTGTLADGTPINERVFLLNGAQPRQITLIEADPFAALRTKVVALGTSGALNQGNTNALLVKLDAAEAALARGNKQAAAGALGAFINQVNAFIRTGKLTAAQGTALTAAAQVILHGLG